MMGKLTTKAFWITSGNVSSRFLNFLATIYLARVLGTSKFGLISIGLSVLGYAVWLSNMGLSTIGTRETAKPAEIREFSPSALFWSRLFAGIIVLGVAWIVLYVLPITESRQFIISLFLLSVIPQALLLDWYFNGLQRYRDVAGSTFSKSLIYLSLTYMIVGSSSDVWWVPIIYFAGSIAAMLFLFARLNQPFQLVRYNLTTVTAKKVIKKSLTVGLGSSFNEVVQLLPAIVIGAFISTADAGVYSAAMKVVLIGAMLDRVFVNMFLPMFTSYWSKNRKKAKQLVSRISRIMLTIGIMVSIFFMIGSRWITLLLFGTDYTASIPLMKILSWFLAATFLNSVFAFGLLAINQDQSYLRSMFRGGLVSAVIITAMTAIGAPIWTAYAVVISEICIMLFNYYEFQEYIKLNIARPALAAIITITLSIILTYTLPLALYWKLPLILSAAFTTHYIMGGIFNTDLTWLYQIAKH